MSSERDSEALESTRKIRVYTKTGDKGTSSLFNGKRRAKTDPIFEALGDTDELNALLGMAREYCSGQSGAELLNQSIVEIQSRLLDVGSHIATPLSSSKEHQIRMIISITLTIVL